MSNADCGSPCSMCMVIVGIWVTNALTMPLHLAHLGSSLAITSSHAGFIIILTPLCVSDDCNNISDGLGTIATHWNKCNDHSHSRIEVSVSFSHRFHRVLVQFTWLYIVVCFSCSQLFTPWLLFPRPCDGSIFLHLRLPYRVSMTSSSTTWGILYWNCFSSGRPMAFSPLISWKSTWPTLHVLVTLLLIYHVIRRRCSSLHKDTLGTTAHWTPYDSMVPLPSPRRCVWRVARTLWFKLFLFTFSRWCFFISCFSVSKYGCSKNGHHPSQGHDLRSSLNPKRQRRWSASMLFWIKLIYTAGVSLSCDMKVKRAGTFIVFCPSEELPIYIHSSKASLIGIYFTDNWPSVSLFLFLVTIKCWCGTIATMFSQVLERDSHDLCRSSLVDAPSRWRGHVHVVRAM